ncbi:MAG: hypothetical protein ACM3O8_10860 [Methylococcaceae bacterium]|nr:hypothetical protein [Prolixibacteraceae bacterium]
MTALELKKHLIHRIAEINDESFLDAIKTILDSKSQSQQLMLSKEQREEIMKSKEQIKQGQYLEQAEMDEKFNQWLSEK